MLQNSAGKEARGKSDFISGFSDAWRVQEFWLWFQFEFVLRKVIMQRAAGCIMRWSSNTWRRIVPQIISMHMDVNEAEGAEGGRGWKNADAVRSWCDATADKRNGAVLNLRTGVFTRVRINVNVEGVDGIRLAFYPLCIILQHVFSVVTPRSLPSAATPHRGGCKWNSVECVYWAGSRDREAKQIKCGVAFQRCASICQIAAPWKVVKDSFFLLQTQQI